MVDATDKPLVHKSAKRLLRDIRKIPEKFPDENELMIKGRILDRLKRPIKRFLAGKLNDPEQVTAAGIPNAKANRNMLEAMATGLTEMLLVMGEVETDPNRQPHTVTAPPAAPAEPPVAPAEAPPPATDPVPQHVPAAVDYSGLDRHITYQATSPYPGWPPVSSAPPQRWYQKLLHALWLD